ncbi:hypothetical protein E3C22_19380 [Jiella endophytica]|uniref:Uncharacterized protein n=1 Tax=Jiella endophytica TaxID=2558362 RepID=A0A4Y8RED7_9HYPH|nr:hypothetical protein [Jiella endophytica]TFF19836.1 hypothetical protein E3C22_19380 [Jiella endophytica]
MDYLRQLSADALLVANFGLKSGKLDSDRLARAIQGLAAKPDADLSTPETLTLQQELRLALHKIQPVTLIDLQQGFDPFARDGEGAPERRVTPFIDRLFKWSFFWLALVLAVLCSYYTSWQREADKLFVEVSQLEDDRQAALLDEIIFAAFGAKDVFDLRVSDPARSSGAVALQDRMNTLRRYDIRLNTVANRAARLTLNANVLDYAIASIKAMLFTYGRNVPQGDCFLPEARKIIDATEKGDDNFSRFLQGVDLLSGARYVLRCKLRMNGSDFIQIEESVSEKVEVVRNFYPTVTQWLLPALYGAFGAVMYFMRIYITSIYPDPPRSAVLFRVILAAFTGIFVVWFTTPSVISDAGIVNLSFGSLFLAFIFGFSVDIFYDILDKLARTAGNAVGQLGSGGGSGGKQGG